MAETERMRATIRTYLKERGWPHTVLCVPFELSKEQVGQLLSTERDTEGVRDLLTRIIAYYGMYK